MREGRREAISRPTLHETLGVQGVILVFFRGVSADVQLHATRTVLVEEEWHRVNSHLTAM